MRQLGACLPGYHQNSANCLGAVARPSRRAPTFGNEPSLTVGLLPRSRNEVTMKAVKERLFKPLNRAEIGREIEEELSLHLELLTQEHLRSDLPLAEARAAALKRFGDVKQIKDECVEISRRRHPLILVLKSFLILVFLAGVLLRVFVAEYHVKHCADILMAVGILGRLLLYARGLKPSSFLAKPETSSPLMLFDKSQTSVAAYDPSKRTPVERLIFDK